MIRMTMAPSRLMLALITLLSLGLTDARAQPTACGSDIRRIEVNQTTLHYFECGKGEPLVFVHGSLGDLHTFRRTGANVRHELQGHRLQPAFLPAQRSATRDRPQSCEQSRCGSASADHATESHSGASRRQLLWRVRRARAGSGPSRTRAQPRSRRAARPASALPHVSGRSPATVVSSDESSSQRGKRSRAGARGRSAHFRGRRHREPRGFDKLPPLSEARRTEFVAKGPELRAHLMTEPAAFPPSTVEIWGS